jgi:hypothetical protein
MAEDYRRETIDVTVLPLGSVVASLDAVAIRRFDPVDQDYYWMPAEGYPLPLTDKQMQSRIDKDPTYRVLRVGQERP